MEFLPTCQDGKHANESSNTAPTDIELITCYTLLTLMTGFQLAPIIFILASSIPFAASAATPVTCSFKVSVAVLIPTARRARARQPCASQKGGIYQFKIDRCARLSAVHGLHGAAGVLQQMEALQGSHAADGANTPCHVAHMLFCHQAVGESMPQQSHALASCSSSSILPETGEATSEAGWRSFLQTLNS